MRKILLMIGAVQLVLVMCASSYGASDKCTVVRVDSNQLTLECGKKAGGFKVNDKIKIKTIKQKSVEGC
ncbi:MAG: hypothetical protein ACI8ZB_001068 [Desulforhopalus sp.]|jgi:hypothetical protein